VLCIRDPVLTEPSSISPSVMIGSDSFNGQYRLCILLNCIGIRRPSVFLIGCCEMAALICWISCKQRLMGDMRLVNVPLERKTNVFPQRSSLHSTRLGLRHTHELEDRNHDKAALYSFLLFSPATYSCIACPWGTSSSRSLKAGYVLHARNISMSDTALTNAL